MVRKAIVRNPRLHRLIHNTYCKSMMRITKRVGSITIPPGSVFTSGAVITPPPAQPPPPPPPPPGGSGKKNLGSWFQLVDVPQVWVTSPSQFATEFFSGPARFTSFEGIINENFSAEISWLDQFATAADSMPNALIEVMCVMIPAFPMASWQGMVDTLKHHSSITSFGLNAERSNATTTDLRTMESYALSAGKRFISYYLSQRGLQDGTFSEIAHTNFPREAQYQVVPVTQLDGANKAPAVGQSQGYFAPYMDSYWGQTEVDEILQHRGAIPLPAGEFCNLAYFDILNPTFQGLVAGSNYRGLFK